MNTHSYRLPRSLALLLLISTSAIANPPAAATPLTKAAQEAITPAEALARLTAGNARFVAGQTQPRDWKQERDQTAAAQYPFAFVLSCVDSRTPGEVIFDQGLGAIFQARVAGNVVDDDILGSMEFACKVAGAKLIVVMGHTHCGAVKGACTDAQLGHLTGLLAKIKPAVATARAKHPDAAATDTSFVSAVAETNVRLVLEQIGQRSPVLREMIASGQVGLAGGLYDLASGSVTLEPARLK